MASDLSENEVIMKYKVALKKSKEGYSVSCQYLFLRNGFYVQARTWLRNSKMTAASSEVVA